MLCLSGFELYSRWVPLTYSFIPNIFVNVNLFLLIESVEGTTKKFITRLTAHSRIEKQP